MCIYEDPRKPCDSQCGHLKIEASVDELLSRLRPLPPLPEVDGPDIRGSSLEDYLQEQVNLLETLLEQTSRMSGVISEVNKRMEDLREYSVSRMEK
jgi:hypothetical protein